MFDIMLWPHIVTAMYVFFVGFALFYSRPFKKSPKIEMTLYYSIMVCLTIAAITGALLQLNHFSPFHILVGVTLYNIPISWRALQRNDMFAFRENLFENYMGLTIALIGALHPLRNLGTRLFRVMFGLDIDTSTPIWTGMLVAIIILTVYLIYRAQNNKMPHTSDVKKIKKNKS